MFSQEQRIAIVEFYFAIKSHCHVINAFQQKHPGETPNASTITLLEQQFRDTGSIVDRKRSGRASIGKTKVADVETVLQRNPLKRPYVYINIVTEFISLLKVMEGTLGCSKTAKRVIYHGTVDERDWKHPVDGTVHVKSIEAQTAFVGVEWKFSEWSSLVIHCSRHFSLVQNYEVPSKLISECDVDN
ncbi:DUF4817 domain-containing protein [Trichonephila clavipes]|nr:DUF4817 domain-containing protein [Trichonephila clavipes]